MGYKLAAKVRRDWADLNSGPYRLLAEIASALPDSGPRMCWFGRDRYVLMIGRNPTSDSEWASARKSAQRHLKALTEAGALRLVQSAHRGRTTVYQLVLPSEKGGHLMSTFSEPEPARKVDGMVDTLVDGMVDTENPERWTVFGQKGGQKLSTQGRSEEESNSPSVTSGPPKSETKATAEQVDDVLRALGSKYPTYPSNQKVDEVCEAIGRKIGHPRDLTAQEADKLLQTLNSPRATSEQVRAILNAARNTTEPGDDHGRD